MPAWCNQLFSSLGERAYSSSVSFPELKYICTEYRNLCVCVSAAGSTWSGMRGCSSSSTSIKTSPSIEWGISPTHTNTQPWNTLNFTLPSWRLCKAHTFPFMSLIHHCLLLFWREAIFLQGLDCALPDHGLSSKLTVVDDFDDNGRHVEVLTGKPLEMKTDYYDWLLWHTTLMPTGYNCCWFSFLSSIMKKTHFWGGVIAASKIRKWHYFKLGSSTVG